MQLTFYGVRGSYPVARRDQVRYGGNTTCLHFRSQSGQHLILDGGSGIRMLGKKMMQDEFGAGRGQAHILVGHTHWDHILGYPFFYPFYRTGNQFTFVAARRIGRQIRQILSGQQTDLHFPVSFERLQAAIDYHPFISGDCMQFGDYRIETVQLNHPGITVGYRIEADGQVVTVFTDAARVRRVRLGDGMGGPEPDAGFARTYLDELTHCARHSDILVHDTQFFEYEMAGRYDWGHSTVEDAMEIARLADVKKLALFHYDPDHSDMVIDQQLRLAKDLSRYDSFTVIAAMEGLKLAVGAEVAAMQELA